MVNGDPNPDRPDLLPYGAGEPSHPPGASRRSECDLRRDGGAYAEVAAAARAGAGGTGDGGGVVTVAGRCRRSDSDQVARGESARYGADSRREANANPTKN